MYAQDSFQVRKYYTNEKNKEIFMPLGNLSFADTVISFKPGNPSAKHPYNDPKKSLGEPDFNTYRTNNPKYVSIGCGGSLTLKFTNGFIDIHGPDLVFFEIGPSVEPFRLEISTDAEKWYKLGNVSGGTSKVDIGKFIRPTKPPRIYHYVRLTDLKHFCDGPTPGSDIDAVGTIGAVLSLNLNDQVLFDTAKFSLREKAKHALQDLAGHLDNIPKAKIMINGYTDGRGGDDYNMTLGKNRAFAVQTYFKSLLKSPKHYSFEVYSYGKTKPLSTNTTKEGRQKNRRVDIVVIPDQEFYKPPKE